MANKTIDVVNYSVHGQTTTVPALSTFGSETQNLDGRSWPRGMCSPPCSTYHMALTYLPIKTEYHLGCIIPNGISWALLDIRK